MAQIEDSYIDMLARAITNEFTPEDKRHKDYTKMAVLRSYFRGTNSKGTPVTLEQIRSKLVTFKVPELNNYMYKIGWALLMCTSYNIQDIKDKSTELFNAVFSDVREKINLESREIQQIYPVPSAPPAAFTAKATLLAEGTSEQVKQQLGISGNTPVTVTVEGANMTIAPLQGGGAHRDHLSGGASRQVIISALQTLLNQSGADLLPDEAFTKMSTEALAETVVDLTRARHNF